MTRKHQPTGRAPTISGHPLGSAADIAYHRRSRAQVERPVIAEAPVVIEAPVVTDAINPFSVGALFGAGLGEEH